MAVEAQRSRRRKKKRPEFATGKPMLVLFCSLVPGRAGKSGSDEVRTVLK